MDQNVEQYEKTEYSKCVSIQDVIYALCLRSFPRGS